MEWHYPKNINSLEDHYAAHRARMWQFGVFAHPLFYGDYPEDIKNGVMLVNEANGITLDRLLDFSENEKYLIKGEFMYANFRISSVLYCRVIQTN